MEHTLVFDIETVPLPFDSSFDDVQKEYLLKSATTDEEREEIKSRGALNPFLGKIVCIGTFIHEQDRGTALYIGEASEEETIVEGGMNIRYKSFTDEAALLQHWWNGMANKFSAVVSFNGRGFDCPFLMLRSAALGIRPSVNMMSGTRWEFKVGGTDKWSGIEHIDLADKLCFGNGFDRGGAMRRFNLDFYTRAFGIPSPKSGGIAGHQVPEFFAQGRSKEIAEYCMRDVKATSELYGRWCDFLRF